ncbi:MAG TPA: GNAT family N-acetyltransferase [Edaphobacter sp.]|nr:GNAT family N-acetyltransferase [Edaphobacter sp.]
MATIATEANQLELREIRPEDATAVAELSGQLGYESSADEMRQRIEAILPLSKSHLIVVASLEGVVVGWVEAEVARHLQSAPHTLITGLVVKDGVRSLGIGQRLCAEVEQWTRRLGISVVRVTSRMTRERAHRFYLREGYVQSKTSAVFEKILSGSSD